MNDEMRHSKEAKFNKAELECFSKKDF